MKRNSRAGVTLVELLVAVTLFAMLSVGMLYAFRIGLMAYSKTQTRLMDNRRVAGAQRILLQELQNMVPVVVAMRRRRGRGTQDAVLPGRAAGHAAGIHLFAAGRVARHAAVSWRSSSSPGENGQGVRLLVNEIPYARTPGGRPIVYRAGALCAGIGVVQVLRAGGQAGVLPVHLPAGAAGSGAGARVVAAVSDRRDSGRTRCVSTWRPLHPIRRGCSRSA